MKTAITKFEIPDVSFSSSKPMRVLRSLAFCLPLLAAQNAAAQTSWVDWTSATAGNPGMATGKITGACAMKVSYTGEVSPQTVTNDSYPSWTPDASFSGGTVTQAPTHDDLIAIVGGVDSVNTVTFSRPVRNPVVAIWSLGSPSASSSFVFSEGPISLQSGGPNAEFGGGPITASGNTVVGVEGNGTVQLKGTFTSISWTNPLSEFYFGFTIGVSGCTRVPSVRVGDVSVTEGPNGKTSSARFLVTLTAASTQRVTLNYVTINGTAKAPGDYTAKRGTLSFAPGKTSQFVSIAVKGDSNRESNETFHLKLSNAVNATIADSKGIGTIRNDD